MFDIEKFAEEVDAEILHTRKDLAVIVRVAANQTVKSFQEGRDGAADKLAYLAYAFACLEGAQRGILPGPPPLPEES
jgi:hypothetical protein